MQILTGIEHNASHNLHGTGAYEWWYVDALSSDGQWGVVAILFRGMPMSPTYLKNPKQMRAGCAVSIYHHGVRIAFSFTEYPLEHAIFDENSIHVEVGTSSLVVDQDGILRVRCHVPCDVDGRLIELEIVGKTTIDYRDCRNEMSDLHAWVLAQPFMQADVLVSIMEQYKPVVTQAFAATVYHDHNLGRRAMHCDFHHWYWGRVHLRDTAYVFLATPNSSDNNIHVYEIYRDGSIVPWIDVSVHFEKPSISMMGLVSHKHVVVRGASTDGVRHELVCKNDQTCEDGPFYQRYISSWILDGQPCGLGMSEYMFVARMQSAWIRPFLRLPMITAMDRL